MSLENTKLLITPNGYKAGKLYSALPESGAGDSTFARATTATRVNAEGLIEEVGLNVPRVDYPVSGGCPSLLLEPQRTNLYINSETLITQSNTTISGVYTVSFYGTGTITLSGSASGILIGTGENERVNLLFTASAGTLTSTVSGSVLNAQLEQGTQATSYIPTLASAVTRNTDVLSNDMTATVDSTYTALLDVSASDSRLKIEDGTTGFDLPLNGAGRIVMVVDSDIKFYFPDNGQATTVLTYSKPSYLRNIDVLSKINETKIKVIAIENGVALQSRIDSWVSGSVSSYFIDTDWSLESSFLSEFRESDWDYFPLINTSNGTNFTFAWFDNNLTSFPLIDTSSGATFQSAWRDNNLTSFPLIDTSSGTNFQQSWQNNNLTSFPLIDTSSGSNFSFAWLRNNLTSFPLIDTSNGTTFQSAWRDNNLTTWLPNYFDTCVGTNFDLAWTNNAIDQIGVDNILVSINTARLAGVQTGTTKIIGLNLGTNATPSATGQAATDALRANGWTVNLNGY